MVYFLGCKDGVVVGVGGLAEGSEIGSRRERFPTAPKVSTDFLEDLETW